MELETLDYREADGVAIVTLNRPEVHNAFNEKMQTELRDTWQQLRSNDDVRAIVLTAAGDRAFCTGIDRSEVPAEEGDYYFTPYTYDDPGLVIGPRSQDLWKPIVAAVNGIACGGGFYLLGESDILIVSENATFFDPHVTYAMPAVFEPNLMLDKMPFGEAMRMTLMGAHERISAARAHEIGLITEVVPFEELRDRADRDRHDHRRPAGRRHPGVVADAVGRPSDRRRPHEVARQRVPQPVDQRRDAPRGPGDVLRRTADQAPHPLTPRPRSAVVLPPASGSSRRLRVPLELGTLSGACRPKRGAVRGRA